MDLLHPHAVREEMDTLWLLLGGVKGGLAISRQKHRIYLHTGADATPAWDHEVLARPVCCRIPDLHTEPFVGQSLPLP